MHGILCKGRNRDGSAYVTWEPPYEPARRGLGVLRIMATGPDHGDAMAHLRDALAVASDHIEQAIETIPGPDQNG